MRWFFEFLSDFLEQTLEVDRSERSLCEADRFDRATDLALLRRFRSRTLKALLNHCDGSTRISSSSSSNRKYVRTRKPNLHAQRPTAGGDLSRSDRAT